ncbi:MAG: ribosome maturation factor RimP [Acetobacteraceae bacterium]
MTDHSLRPDLQDRIADLVGPTLEAMGYELVRIALGAGRAARVQIMAERTDGAAMAVADCTAISHRLGAVLDVLDPLPGAWTLEVSSPGIDRPLVRAKDWNRFSGHLARVELAAPVAGRRRLSGTVLGADEGEARLRLDDGTEIALPFAAIRRARLVLTEALMRATAPSHASN